METFEAALDLAIGLYADRCWPGSRIPGLAHGLEVACRVAAMGGAETTVLAALLHEAGPDRAEAVRAAFGDPVADLLETCRTRRLLPHGGWDGWLRDAWDGLEDPELRLIVACDALACFRNTLLDWQVLAHLWDEPRTGDPADRAWLVREARLPSSDCMIRGRWVPPGLEHPSAQAIRGGLVDAYRGWLALPLGDPGAVSRHPALALAYQGDAWARWVEGQELVPLLRAWGLQGPATELAGLLGSLSGLPGLAHAGFLRRSAQAVEFMGPGIADACLRRMTLVELMLVLRNRTSSLVRAFRRHLPQDLLDLCPEGRDRTMDATLSVPILLHWIGEVARDGRVLSIPPLAPPGPEPVPPVPFPATGRFRAAVSLLLAELGGERWPGTTIAYAFHPLEVASLVLTAGWDEETAVLALLHDLPRTADASDRAGAALGPETARSLEAFWRMTGPLHRVPGAFVPDQDPESAPPAVQAVGLMDATSLLRFVAEDFHALVPALCLHRDPARDELTQRFEFFKGILYGKPLGLIAENVLIGSRFGPSLLAWRKALPVVRPDPELLLLCVHPRRDVKPDELGALFARLGLPLTEVCALISTLEFLPPEAVEKLVRELGPARAVEAFMDEGWAPVWQIVQAKLEPALRELMGWQFLGSIPDPRTVRAAQTAFLAVVARMRRGILLADRISNL